MEPDGDGLTIGIESAIEGGSLALFHEGVQVDGVVGEKGSSRAEDILPNLDHLLLRNGFPREEIKKVAFSTGPGSFTGIKIGIAASLGLADGLCCPAVGMSALEAMTYAAGADGNVLSVVPVGREFVAIQNFEKADGTVSPISDPKLLREHDLKQTLAASQGTAVLYFRLIDRLGPITAANVVVAGPNIASLVIRGDLSGATRQNIVPLFIDRTPSP